MKQDEVYLKRLIEHQMDFMMHTSGAVVVAGPKFCGKSTLCRQFAKSSTVLNTSQQIELAEADPKVMLKGEKPRLIDEWQKVPDIWNEIKNDLDEKYVFGKYILTGSTTPVDPKKIKHSGSGRFSRIDLRTFSMYESNESNGLVSLASLFDNPEIKQNQFLLPSENKISLEDVAHIICRGGWPLSVLSKREYSTGVTKNYFNGLFNVEDEDDDYAVFLKNKNIDLLKMILNEYARNISTQIKKTKMIEDILASGERAKLDEDTFDSYVKTLKDLFIVYDMPSWNLNLRSSVSVRSAPTRHFYDTSIALAALNINENDLMNDLNSFGFFFEDWAVHDLIVYASSLNATFKHYRDSNGMEVDAIIELPNGLYGAVEVKIASEKNVNSGISSLNTFEQAMERNGIKKPTFKLLLTSHGGCYVKDGVNVVPISCLKD